LKNVFSKQLVFLHCDVAALPFRNLCSFELYTVIIYENKDSRKNTPQKNKLTTKP
jgi:hypothetical protein